MPLFLLKVDVHQSPELKKALGVRAVPTVKLHAGSLGQVASFTCGPKRVRYCGFALILCLRSVSPPPCSDSLCWVLGDGRVFVHHDMIVELLLGFRDSLQRSRLGLTFVVVSAPC